MRPLFMVLIVMIGGICAAIVYKKRSADAGVASARHDVVSQPAVAPLSLEERAARAQGTTLPAEARRPYPVAPVEESVERAHSAAPVTRYRCDGRIYCREMHSCEEATWFLQNCPGTKMDGDGDGQPCEDQFCGHR